MNSTENQKKLLWIDDDPKDRFSFEIDSLVEDYDWAIDHCNNLSDAIDQLSKHKYNAVVLDQMFPLSKTHQREEVWAGAFFLLHARNKQGLWDPNIHKETAELLEKSILCPPLPENQNTTIVFVSAFHDTNVYKMLRKAEPNLNYHSKPINFIKLLAAIHQKHQPPLSELESTT